MPKRCLLFVALIVLVVSSCAACGGTPTAQHEPTCPITIGVITSRTGKQASVGKEAEMGYDLAVQEINDAGGVLGCELALRYVDDGSESRGAQVALKALVEEDGVPLVIGTPSSETTMPVAGVVNAYQVPLLVPVASSDLITARGYDWVFRIIAPSQAYAQAALSFIQKQGRTRIAMIYEDSFFGESIAVPGAIGAPDLGLQVVAYESFKPGLPDYLALLQRVKAAAPEVLYLVARPAEAGKLLQECEQVGLDAQIYMGLGGGYIASDFPTKGGRHAEYVIATTQWNPDVTWPGTSDFIQRFQAAYNMVPGTRHAQSYVALYLVKDVLERLDPELDWSSIANVRLAIRNAFRETNIAVTDKTSPAPLNIFGPIRFEVTGQNSHAVLLVQVLDGQFVTVYPKPPAVNSPVVPAPPWYERP
jgi:branched-chain amino acid transport system substrate-binding protein